MFLKLEPPNPLKKHVFVCFREFLREKWLTFGVNLEVHDDFLTQDWYKTLNVFGEGEGAAQLLFITPTQLRLEHEYALVNHNWVIQVTFEHLEELVAIYVLLFEIIHYFLIYSLCLANSTLLYVLFGLWFSCLQSCVSLWLVFWLTNRRENKTMTKILSLMYISK